MFHYRGVVSTSTSAREPFLVVEDGNDKQTVRLFRDVTRLGRGNDNEVQLVYGRVSKRHAEIRRSDNVLTVVDVGSKAGVYVNGKLEQECELADGDVILLGRSCPTRIVVRHPAGQKVREGSGILSSLGDTQGREGLRSLARFLEFSRVLSGGLAPAEILDNVVDMALEITGAERGFAILAGADGEMHFEAKRSHDGQPIPPGQARISGTIVRQVLEEKKSRIVSDVGADEALSGQHSVMSLELGSAVAMPLWRHALPGDDAPQAQATDEVFGVLYLDSKQRRRAFDKIDVGILENLAFDASSAIENARLLRESEDKRRMERELATAREVQASLLPASFWGTDYSEVAGLCVPCLDLGGDYLGQFRLPGERMGFVVADVSGKGLPAALLAAALQGAVAAEFDAERPLGEIVAKINRVICDLAPLGMFVSALFGILAPDGELVIVNAGHCPLLSAGEGGIEGLVTGGMALGFDEGAAYEERRLQLPKGQVLVLYTDGVLEMDNTERELFGEERLEKIVSDLREAPAEDVAKGILAAVDEFRSGAPVADDLTLMVIRYRG